MVLSPRGRDGQDHHEPHLLEGGATLSKQLGHVILQTADSDCSVPDAQALFEKKDKDAPVSLDISNTSLVFCTIVSHLYIKT